MCIRDRGGGAVSEGASRETEAPRTWKYPRRNPKEKAPACGRGYLFESIGGDGQNRHPVSYTHLRAHETVLDIVCRLLLEKKNTTAHTKDLLPIQ